mmetsp:Transcript_11686/g.30887  ORF Transcript_11686/g.30887 Transcript_11686/m.30887 type:complete len:266 (+) Transcript_11686:469-1266(+)
MTKRSEAPPRRDRARELPRPTQQQTQPQNQTTRRRRLPSYSNRQSPSCTREREDFRARSSTRLNLTGFSSSTYKAATSSPRTRSTATCGLTKLCRAPYRRPSSSTRWHTTRTKARACTHRIGARHYPRCSASTRSRAWHAHLCGRLRLRQDWRPCPRPNACSLCSSRSCSTRGRRVVRCRRPSQATRQQIASHPRRRRRSLPWSTWTRMLSSQQQLPRAWRGSLQRQLIASHPRHRWRRPRRLASTRSRRLPSYQRYQTSLRRTR